MCKCDKCKCEITGTSDDTIMGFDPVTNNYWTICFSCDENIDWKIKAPTAPYTKPILYTGDLNG